MQLTDCDFAALNDGKTRSDITDEGASDQYVTTLPSHQRMNQSSTEMPLLLFLIDTFLCRPR